MKSFLACLLIIVGILFVLAMTKLTVDHQVRKAGIEKWCQFNRCQLVHAKEVCFTRSPFGYCREHVFKAEVKTGNRIRVVWFRIDERNRLVDLVRENWPAGGGKSSKFDID